MAKIEQAYSSFSKKITGDISVPGDKSLSHRALILASQSVGLSKIIGLLEADLYLPKFIRP